MWQRLFYTRRHVASHRSLHYLVNTVAQFEGSGPTAHSTLSIRSLARGLQVEWGESAH